MYQFSRPWVWPADSLFVTDAVGIPVVVERPGLV